LTGSGEVKVADDLIVNRRYLFMAHGLCHAHHLISDLPNDGIDRSIGFGHFPDEHTGKDPILFFVGWSEVIECLLSCSRRKDDHLPRSSRRRGQASTLANCAASGLEWVVTTGVDQRER
jgi:hypothetical protein